MAVIITNRELPYSCINCWNKADCDYCDRYLRDPHFKHPNCPLKSADEMIKEIEQYFEKKSAEYQNEFMEDTHDSHRDSCNYGRLNATTRNKESVTAIIHKYTDKEQT